MIENWVKEGWIEWWGFQADMLRVFGQCHLVCLPTKYREGVPRVLIEAAACARAIVATDVAGCREVVRHGESGLLFEPGSPDALANAVLTLLDDPDRRRAMGRRGREIVAEGEFAIEHVVERTLAVYGELLGKAGTAAIPAIKPYLESAVERPFQAKTDRSPL